MDYRRSPARMIQIFCRDCRRRSLVNAAFGKICLSCGRYIDRPRAIAPRWRIPSSRECPSCNILHPGRNVGAPYCGKCNQRRLYVPLDLSDDSSYSDFYEHFHHGHYSSDDSDEDSFFGWGSVQFFELDRIIKGKPLSDRAISQLTRKLVDLSDKQECSICIDYLDRHSISIQLPCSHLYHEKCILTWFKSNNSCPLCRKTIPNHI